MDVLDHRPVIGDVIHADAVRALKRRCEGAQVPYITMRVCRLPTKRVPSDEN